jgi:hypothetical protein
MTQIASTKNTPTIRNVVRGWKYCAIGNIRRQTSNRTPAETRKVLGICKGPSITGKRTTHKDEITVAVQPGIYRETASTYAFDKEVKKYHTPKTASIK